MPSKTRGTKIKKSRLMLILKSRKITVTNLAERTGYNRGSLSYAINREYMDNKTLDDIARYLNVSPDFLTGAYPLQRIKPEYKNGFDHNGKHYRVYENIDPSGYDIPPYQLFNIRVITNNSIRFQSDLINAPYADFLISLGKNGMIADIHNTAEPVYFDSSFVKSNEGYLISPIREKVVDTVMSALNKSDAYMRWYEKHGIKRVPADDFPQIFEVIEEGSDPDGKETDSEN